MKLLALESSSSIGSVALRIQGEHAGEVVLAKGMHHGRELVPAVKQVLEEASLTVRDLDCIAISNGPGSYTGLRVGLACAKGLCFSCTIPLVAIDTLQAMAFNAPTETRNIRPFVDARWEQVYSGLYDGSGDIPICIESPEPITLADLGSRVDATTYLFGDGLIRYAEQVADWPVVTGERHTWYPAARNVAILGEIRFHENQFEDLDSLAPVYLRKTEAEVKLEKKKATDGG